MFTCLPAMQLRVLKPAINGSVHALHANLDKETYANQHSMLILGLRVLELDRLYGPTRTLAYILMYLNARELKMLIDGYDDPLGPSSPSLPSTVIDYLRERFETLTGMPLSEANDTRIRPEIPLPFWWNKWETPIVYQRGYSTVRYLIIRIPNDDPRPWTFQVWYDEPDFKASCGPELEKSTQGISAQDSDALPQA